jgi:ABC-type transport system involved in cytochrome bd biosynthesis fused ATPase/permease subunit
LEENLRIVEANLSCFAFSAQEWSSFIEAYRAQGMPAIHHSEQYRQAEKPAYRLVRRDMLRILPVLEAAACCGTKPCVIAIDGRAGSGKSTAAEIVAERLKASNAVASVKTEEMTAIGKNGSLQQFTMTIKFGKKEEGK